MRDNTGTILNITDSSYIGIQDSSNSSPPTVSYLGNLNYNGYDKFEYFLLDNQTFMKGDEPQTYECICKLVPFVDTDKVKVY